MAVKVRERASRRAVKQAVDAAEAEARAHQVAEQLVGWYNQQVGVSMLQYARLGKGRRLHILDTTRVEVALETGTYECSGVVKNEDGTLSRGYKLVPLLAGGSPGVAGWRFAPRRSWLYRWGDGI